MISNLARVNRCRQLLVATGNRMLSTEIERKIYFRSGALKPMPLVNNFGIFGVVLTIVPGILLGAIISKNIASFLEENELFVPDDEDDD